jgi:malate synthase
MNAVQAVILLAVLSRVFVTSTVATMTGSSASILGLQIVAPAHPAQEHVLTPAALEFIVGLQRRFNPRRVELLAARAERQKRLDAGEKPDVLPETKAIRES